MNNNIVLRMHRAEDELDWYHLKGNITKEGFIKAYKEIDWNREFKHQVETGEYNYPIVEAFNIKNELYLSISVVPDTQDKYQFSIGVGIHNNVNGQVERFVKLFLTETDDPACAYKLIDAFFNENLELMQTELDKYYFEDEIEDLYQNLN